MDKGKNVQSFSATTFVIVLLLAGQASASNSFKNCFPGCAVECLIGKLSCTFECALKCLGKCLLGHENSLGLDYCKVGCAVDRCAHFANDFKVEDVDKVDECVIKNCKNGHCRHLAQAMTLPTSPLSQNSSTTGAPSPR
ncbi:hypothetical protein ACJIZ3_020369 [Penstemon smallii]|uniref:Uncharacterized protein n=1 Tax=Penstemon smallii TaxID=265156 RepID=A0ABD3SIQ4_9LAMI